ncbi:hypothetical protein [Streptomyces sp. NPDC046925]|uniref:hypothetical protein n=1 Tax=Streptomyces sp. NPDC046925 TaxID=3155375 RepID=UPI0033EDF2AF
MSRRMFSRTSIRTNRRTRALRAAAPIAILALALTACGGSDSGGKSADKPKQASSDSTPKGDNPEGGETESGSMKAGESITVPFKENEPKITYEIAAQKVDLSTEAEAKKIANDPKNAKGLIAAIAHVKFTNKSGGVVESSPDVGRATEIYADGAPASLVLMAAEDAPGCDRTTDIENWQAGQSYTICRTYMVPANAKEIEVRWSDQGGTTYSWAFAAK